MAVDYIVLVVVQIEVVVLLCSRDRTSVLSQFISVLPRKVDDINAPQALAAKMSSSALAQPALFDAEYTKTAVMRR